MAEASLGVLLTATDAASPQLKSFGTTLTANKAAIRELAMGVSYLGMTFLGLGIALEKANSPFGQSVGHLLTMVGSIMSAVGASVQFISAIAKMVDALKKLQIAQMLVQAFSGPAGWVALGVGAAVATGAVVGMNAYNRSQEKTAKEITGSNSINYRTTNNQNSIYYRTINNQNVSVGTAVASAAPSGTIAYNRSQEKAQTKVTIENKVILDGRQISATVKKQLVINQQQNNTSGIK